MPGLLLLLDHDNIPYTRVSLRAILQTWLSALRSDLGGTALVTLRIRAYGGWFQDDYVTETRYKAAEFYQVWCPMVLAVADRFFRVTFEFADALLSRNPTEVQSDVVRITHTVASRPLPQYLTLRKDPDSCPQADCRLREVRRWATRKRACTHPQCPMEFSNFFQRREQKQVDVHLAVDTLFQAAAAVPGDHLALASDDWDLLPAIAAAANQICAGASVAVIRFGSHRTYMDELLRSRGVRIITMP